MTNEKRSLTATLVICRIGIAVWFICIPLIPFMARWYDKYSNKPSIFWQFVCCVAAAMIPAGIILYCLNKLLSNIKKKEIFIDNNVTNLRVISYCCFAIAAVSVVMTIWRILALVIVLSFAIMGLLLRVLKNVFEQAVALREESDLTV